MIRSARRARLRSAILAAGIALAVALPLLAGANAVAAPTQQVPHVVVVGTAPLRWSDVGPADTPHLWQLAGGSALGSLSVKAADPVTCPDDGWLTLGAGNRASARDQAGASITKGCPDDGLRVQPVGDGAMVVGFAAAYDRNLRRDDDTHLGALANALQAAGQCVAAAGPPAALAASDDNGHVAVYREDARAAAADGTFLRACPVVLIATDPSDLDTVVGEVQRAATAPTLLAVVGVGEPSGAEAHLQVALAHGPGFDGGRLVSASTRRPPFVQLVDVAPTILQTRGVASSSSMIGQPWQEKPERAPLRDKVTALRRLDVAARHQVAAVVPFWVTLVGLTVVGCVLAWWVARRALRSDAGGRAPSRRLRRFAALACAWCALLPATSFLVGVVSWWSAPLPLLVLGLASLAGATVLTRLAVALEAGIWRRRRYGLAAAVGAITFTVIALDLVTGAHLQIFTMAGYSPLVAGRFAGIGNVAFGIFAAGALLLAAGFGDVVARRAPARLTPGAAVAAVGVLAVAVDGAPPWGSDVGGVLALVPAFGVLAWLVAGRRVSWRRIVAVVVLAIAVIAALGAIDYARPAADQTHLGRFVGELLHGGAWTVVRRKAVADLELLTHSALTLLIPLLVVVAVWLVAVPGRLLRDAFARTAVLRPAAVALLVMALVGAVVNDSGVVIPALAALVAVPAAMTVLAADASSVTDRGEAAEAPPGLLR
jgi:hypothetical protein